MRYRVSIVYMCVKHIYYGARILTSFPFGATERRIYTYMLHRSVPYTNPDRHLYVVPVSGIALGLTHPRRTKLQHGTFLHFGHPRLVNSNTPAPEATVCTI